MILNQDMHFKLMTTGDNCYCIDKTKYKKI